jgi:hypothetical protein
MKVAAASNALATPSLHATGMQAVRHLLEA